jgi:hypothetical protein
MTISRTSLVGGLLSLLSVGCVQEAGGVTPGIDHPGEAPREAATSERDLAIDRARETLRAAGVDPSTLTVAAAEPVTWSNSGLGCAQPGEMTLAVLTPGYRVELRGAQRNYVVHVAGNRAIVCNDRVGSGARGGPAALKHPIVPLRGIEAMTQRAREMLATAVGAPVEQIRVVGFEPQVWPDTGLGCPTAPDGPARDGPASPAVPGRVSGFRIMLEHEGRGYTFNTDLHRVIACPPIDAE